MPFNIIQAIEAQITPDTVGRIAESSGETPAKTRAAMSTGVVALAAGIVHRGSSTAGAASILSTFGAGGAPSSLLGDRADVVTDTVARSSGVGRSTASGIMSALLPIAGVVLGREITSRRLDAGGLAQLLQSQKQHLTGQPVEVIDTVAERDVGIYQTAQTTRRAAPVAAEPRRSWLPLLAALALGALLIGLLLFLRGRNAEVSTPEIPTVEAPVVRRPEAPATPTLTPPAEPVGQATLTGAEIAKPGADDLDAHLSGNAPLPDRFTLPGVTFQFGSTALNEGGDATVDRLAGLMKEHPSARVRLEGHTDSTGTAGVNRPLSNQRATKVKQMLIDRGVDASRIETQGKRDEEPVAPNDSKAGRAQNRRIDAVILQR